jgi:hypothetical protein
MTTVYIDGERKDGEPTRLPTWRGPVFLLKPGWSWKDDFAVQRAVRARAQAVRDAGQEPAPEDSIAWDLEEIVRRRVVGWEGVSSNASGEPVPYSPEAVFRLWDDIPDTAPAFQAAYYGLGLERRAEGEGSGASSRGTSTPAEAPDTAPSAEPKPALRTVA